MKKQFSKFGKQVPWRTTSPWRYLTTLLILFALSIGQMWAVDPDYESYDWSSSDADAVVGTHGDVVIGGAFGSKSNVSGHYYLPISNNLKNSDNPWNGYMSISSSSQIETIEIFYCPNGSNQTSVAWAAWGSGVTPNQKTLAHGVTTGTKSSKAWANAVWETIDLSGTEAYTVYLSRSIREFQDKDGNSIANFGGGQTINVLGIKVWLKASSGPVDPTLIFDDGVYTLGGSDLDLSTLITSSNSDGAITYSVKSDPDETGASISGTTFIADAPGTVVVTASQAATSSYNAKSVDFNVVVSAPVPVSSVAVTAPVDGNTYYVGNQVTLAATVQPDNATNKTLNWTMDVNDKATIADGKITFTEAGDFHLTATAADGSNKSHKVHLYVSNPTPITSIALDYNEQHINVGDVITITPTILPVTATNKNLLWSVTEGATITQEGVLTAVVQSDVIVTAAAQDGSDVEGTTHIFIDALPACAELYPATSGASPTQKNEELLLQTEAPNASFGGKIYTAGAKDNNWAASFTYTANGLQLNKGGADSARVELNHLMQAGTVIYAKLVNPDANKARGYKLLTNTGATIATWQATSVDPQEYTYTVVAGDGLEGTNVFRLQRAESSALKELKVSNCGAELFALNSAIDPVAAEGKATITLSKSQVAEGATATATYSDIDAAYDFDEWVINGATIDNAKANPVTITMGSTDATITLKLKAASTKHTVTYYDENDNNLGEELVVEGQHPVGLSIAPRKLGYTFAGWGTSKDGPVVAFPDVTVNADMPLYTIWNEIDCSTLSGTIFSLVLNNAPAANCTIKNATGFDQEADLIKYGTVSGGIALAKNSSSNNHLVITTDPKLRLLGGSGKVHIQFDCALQEGDKIRTTIENQNISYTTADVRSTTNNFVKGTDQELTITSGHALENATEIYLWSASSSDGKLISLEVIRPEKYAVTFNMHGHGDQVAQQNILEGGKVTKPTDPTASGWDFGGWFKESTYDNEWDFDNDVVNAATEIHAKWTEHTTSSDATLKDLTVNGVTVTGFDPATVVYNVVLEMGTTTVAEVAGVPNDDNVTSVVVMQTDVPTDDATITVTAEDGSTSKTYTIHFSIATSKDIELVWDKSVVRCDATTPSAVVKSDDASVSAYINKITATAGGEGNSLNVGKNPGDMFTLSAKPGYAFKAMSFFGKIEDASCEYSLDGGAWQTLTSTNTGGNACYADVFSAAEVHELRMKITGSNGFWIRNMQLTMIEACTPISLAWDEEPVEFEVGKAGYAIAATANNGGTITYGSTDASIVAVDAGNGVLSVAALGSVSLSASTAEGDGTTYCENGGNDIVISKVVNTYYLVTLDAENGGAPAEIKYHSGDAAIAQPADPIFAGHTFDGWLDETDAPVVWPLTPSASLALHASWIADCTAPTINVQPSDANYFTGRTSVALNCEATAAYEGALTYKWYSCDDDLKSNPVELAGAPTPSTAEAGTFYFFCAVTEEGCANVAYSDVAVITVADKDPICLAWVDVTGQNAASLNAGKSLYAPEVSATGIKNSSTHEGKTGWKFNSAPGYIAIEGAPFKAGDIVEMYVTTVTADKARVFNANEAIAANVVAEGAENMVLGANKVALTADANNLYLRRGNDFGGWNPYVAYVAVYRACAPILNSVTVAGVEVAPDNTNHIAIEVPNSTDATALDAIAYDWVSNSAEWTEDPANAPVATNAWEFGVENTVTFTDKDGDASVYYVTISKAAASSDATLSALTVNGQAIALADGVFEYSFELPYGASVAPTVAATANHSAATATVIECDLHSAIIEVVPESGASDKVEYTINFVISKWQEVVIWDGSYMTDVATSPGALGMAWEITGFGSVTNYTTTCADKSYAKVLPSGGSAGSSRSFVLNVPAGYVAKFYVVMASHSDGSERGMFIGSNLVKNPDATSVLELSTSSRDEAVAGMSEIVGAGTWYINPNNSIDFQEIRVYLRKGMVRDQMLGNGVLGTSCVDHNVAIEDIQGATFYELQGRDYNNYGKLAFDEIVSGELEAGVPYVFQAHGDKLVLFYGEDHEDEPVDKGNGMYGTFETIELTELDGIYYFAQRALWSCVDLSSLTVPANRAYVKLDEVDGLEQGSEEPAQGRRRILMTVNAPAIATGIDNLNASEQPVKMLMDGKLFIIRGEKMYDATGRLVK